ncbi:MAG TPA: 2Fe-2S iron-sulfur cluster-binding protein [Burkholderiaceae bacterium]|nr:2Fe-2S iron-sulfur cluster-binding protein [Burkholderiaceae bacterium]
MARVTFVGPDGTATTLRIVAGTSLMRAAVDGGVAGILGECGGACCCATCHVYVDETQIDRLPQPDAREQQMLEFTAAEREPGSRLGCQLIADPALDGLVVRVPADQL